MMRYKNTFSIFLGEQVSEFLEYNSRNIQREIDHSGENYILNVNEEQYIKYLVDKFTINNLNIGFGGVKVDSYQAEIPAENFPSYTSFFQGKTYERMVIVYYLPFTGTQICLNMLLSNI